MPDADCIRAGTRIALGVVLLGYDSPEAFEQLGPYELNGSDVHVLRQAVLSAGWLAARVLADHAAHDPETVRRFRTALCSYIEEMAP